jgi:hypothetical protein
MAAAMSRNVGKRVQKPTIEVLASMQLHVVHNNTPLLYCCEQKMGRCSVYGPYIELRLWDLLLRRSSMTWFETSNTMFSARQVAEDKVGFPRSLICGRLSRCCGALVWRWNVIRRMKGIEIAS